MSLSHFDERGGVIPCTTPWGCWYQTVSTLTVEVNLPNGTRGRDVQVSITPTNIKVTVLGKEILSGNLRCKVVKDETIWTVEERKLLRIQLTKAEAPSSENIWNSLLQGGENEFAPDPLTLLEMRKKLDLEKFQIEHPGFDFSGAKLQKQYEDL